MFHNKITNAGFGTWKRGAAITNPKNVGVALEVTGTGAGRTLRRVSVTV